MKALRVGFAVVAGAAALAACRGAGSYTPTQSYDAPRLVARIANAGSTRAQATLPPCVAKPAKFPGRHLVFTAFGTVSGSYFTASRTNSIWEMIDFLRGTPPPTTSPTSSPTASPTPPPEYAYYGTFNATKQAKLADLKSGECAYLITTQSGKPLPGSKFNGLAQGFPKIVALYYKERLIRVGLLQLSIQHLSPNGGSGSFTMKTISGATAFTGTIHLIGRTALP